MKFTSVFKRTKEALFVNLVKKEKKQVPELDISCYVRPTGCNICNDIIPHCCYDLLQKVNNGEIAANDDLIAYLHEQELIRRSMIEQQERESCETITNDSEEVMSIQSSMNWRYNSETSSSVESPVTATISSTASNIVPIIKLDPIVSPCLKANAHIPSELVPSRTKHATNPNWCAGS
ncbi:uncharacterized protein KNAG_0M01510 [Huiozyma naganishii CBS 8797]|uniref:Uncharacterized protein n=1 Tax=Huiozyma naganishii (strain ATCC MYA-139 / BCRC 22969 / CBS 8797 / KCTC 17520 / NBRC 10181 / NCYC 3082 / Yp74L-3) TaxID=1071383 RepID=J7SAT2_HUIN7|nr:hypothetical protein KNAG_0M01510 [Kazachstania naganishii CBS 8797]CCK73004.1 hypothetical protein KNAG_0M01510 [Kazachstania naganishii CBS 8797]